MDTGGATLEKEGHGASPELESDWGRGRSGLLKAVPTVRQGSGVQLGMGRGRQDGYLPLSLTWHLSKLEGGREEPRAIPVVAASPGLLTLEPRAR